MKKNAGQSRERSTGRYGFSGDMDRLCVCGCRLGIHDAQAPHPCSRQDAHNSDPKRYPEPLPSCGCPRFRPSRKKPPQ